jgi:hypothetical protein
MKMWDVPMNVGFPMNARCLHENAGGPMKEQDSYKVAGSP